jgi:hypothetical protein
MSNHILDTITGFFLTSSDFNGILLSELAEELGMPWPDTRKPISSLLQEGKISLSFTSHTGNPHLKRLPDIPIPEQQAKLTAEEPHTICAYPSAAVIRAAGDLSGYDTRPFTRRLALAEAQLMPVFFDLDVLEQYFRDPRYDFNFYDLAGTISITTEHYQSSAVQERDKVLLQSFGIGYDSERNRVVVVFLRYLSDLSPEHQQIWNAHVISDVCTMNSDYARASIYGAWPEYHSAYQAFLREQTELNVLALLIGKPPLFRETFEDRRPAGFSPMLRPTRKNFHDFVHLLDKLLSENLNLDFFRGDVPLETYRRRSDGTTEVLRKGTLQLLEHWLSAGYRTADGEDIAREVVAPLREIRALRQKPAHALDGDVYDRTYPRRQDELLGKAVRTLTQLRLMLSCHPSARQQYAPPAWLDSDKIVFY